MLTNEIIFCIFRRDPDLMMPKSEDPDLAAKKCEHMEMLQTCSSKGANTEDTETASSK